MLCAEDTQSTQPQHCWKGTPSAGWAPLTNSHCTLRLFRSTYTVHRLSNVDRCCIGWTSGSPGTLPSSITCSFETTCPSLSAFCAKLITVLGVSRPANCKQTVAQASRTSHTCCIGIPATCNTSINTICTRCDSSLASAAVLQSYMLNGSFSSVQ